MKVLIIVNDPPYDTERVYNAFRIAMSLQKADKSTELKVFLMAGSVSCAISGQETPEGYYNIERMLSSVIRKGGIVKFCTTCAKARGVKKDTLVEGVEESNMKELAEWIMNADKVINY